MVDPNLTEGDCGEYDDDDEIDWSSIPLNSISSSMALPTTTTTTNDGGGNAASMSSSTKAAMEVDVEVDVLRREVEELRRRLASSDDRLLELEADACASRIESIRNVELVEKAANERVRLVEEELRRTRHEAERYRAGWTRLSVGGGSGGGRRRRGGGGGGTTTADDDDESGSGVVGGRGRRGGLENDDDDGGRGKDATHAFSSWERGGMMGSLFPPPPPPPVVVDRRSIATGMRILTGSSSGRKVTPRSSSDDEGTRRVRRDENHDDDDDVGAVGPDDDRVVGGVNDDYDDDDRRIEDGITTSISGKRQRRSRYSTTDDDGGAYIDSPARGAFVVGYGGRGVGGGGRRWKASSAVVEDDRVRRSVAMSLLIREGTTSSLSFPSSPRTLLFPPPDALTDVDMATEMRVDRDVEMDARSRVRSILCRMADGGGPTGVDRDDSSSSNLSVSGLIHVLVMRFNSLFRRDAQSSSSNEDGDVAIGERSVTASSSVDREDVAYQGLALVITDSRMMSDDEDEEGSRSWPSAIYTTVSLGAAFYLLGVMRDVLLLSGDARDDVRWWLYRSRQALVCGDGSDGDAVGCTSNRTGPECDVVSMGMGAIRTANCRNEWDPLTMSQPFNLFYELLLGLMKGNVFDHSRYLKALTGKDVSNSPVSVHSLVQSIQLKAIDLVSILMSDAPRYDHLEEGQANRTSFLWSFWFDSLLSSVRSTRQSSEVLLVGDFLSSLEDTDSFRGNHMLGSGRKHSTRLLACSRVSSEQNKRGTDKQGRTSNRQSRADSTSQSSRVLIDGNSRVDSHLSILVKEKILRLLSNFVLSSSYINQGLYRTVDGDTKTSLAKRILSAVLDQVDEYIVPCLSSDPSSDNAGASNIGRCLGLASSCIQFLLIMSRSNEGIRMLRLQMRLESEEDEPSRWSRSSIGCMTAVLNGVLSFAFQIEDMDVPQLKSIGFSRSLTSIVDQCIAFFKVLLLFVERQRESSSTSTTTFLVLISEHRTVFHSCCERILACQSPNKVSDPPCLLRFSEGLKSDVRCLFEELVIDAEKENGDR